MARRGVGAQDSFDALLQSSDGAALLELSIGNAEKIYSFTVASPEGGFIIRDTDGNEETFVPLE